MVLCYNQGMKFRLLIGVALMALISTAAIASEKGGVDLSVSSFLLSGSTQELVFIDGDLLSELIWPMETVPGFGLEAGRALGGGYRISVSLDAAVPVDSGSMEDSDFMNIPENNDKTHYSRHDARLEHLVDIGIALSRELHTDIQGPGTRRRLTLSPGLGVRIRSCAWSASDGYTQYSLVGGTGEYEGWEKNLPKDYLSGKVITYRQDYLLAFASLAANLPIGSAWAVSAEVKASPFIACTAKDQHLLTGFTFRDGMSGGLFFEPTLTISRQSGAGDGTEAGHRFFLAGSWTRFAGLRGDTTTRTLGGELVGRDEDSCGTESGVFSVRAGYTLILGAKKAD